MFAGVFPPPLAEPRLLQSFVSLAPTRRSPSKGLVTCNVRVSFLRWSPRSLSRAVPPMQLHQSKRLSPLPLQSERVRAREATSCCSMERGFRQILLIVSPRSAGPSRTQTERRVLLPLLDSVVRPQRSSGRSAVLVMYRLTTLFRSTVQWPPLGPTSLT